MKLSDYVMQFLGEKGIVTMFFVPGGGCMHLTDSLARSEKITGVSLLHEQGATVAAESYAFTSGRVGAALLTTGPGGTNGITGVLSAYLDSIPCIIVSGQVKTSDLKRRFGVRSHGSQEADIITMVKEITKYAVMITDKKSIRYHLEKAWHEATTGRKGPVWIDIPLDIQGSDIDEGKLVGYAKPVKGMSNIAKELIEVKRMLEEAKRPVLLVGNGIRGAEKELEAFINRFKLPMIPTWKAADLIANDHPLYIGKCGTMGERAANFAMQTADLILSLGCKLDFSITGFDRSKWAVGAKKIIVEIDEAELYKLQIPVDLPIVCDGGTFLRELNGLSMEVPDFSVWEKKIKTWKIRYPLEIPDTSDAGLISTYHLVDEVCKQMACDSVLVPASAGTVAEITYQAMKLKKGHRVRSNHGLGAMGYEIPSAIGAAIASEGMVITLCGDGGMQLNIQELAILAGRNLPVKIFVVNNGGYSSIRNMQRNHFNGRYIGSNEETGLFLPDMTGLAKAYGIPSTTVKKLEELEEKVGEALSCQGPFLCDVHIDPFCIVSPRSTSKVLADGNIVSTPLEDLFPFLPEDVLKNELLIDEPPIV